MEFIERDDLYILSGGQEFFSENTGQGYCSDCDGNVTGYYYYINHERDFPFAYECECGIRA